MEVISEGRKVHEISGVENREQQQKSEGDLHSLSPENFPSKLSFKISETYGKKES
jgi:hypothetical protein